jgi:hypothetical protein
VYDDNRDAIASSRAASGTYFSGAHLADVRDMALIAAGIWADDSLETVDSYRPSIDESAILEMIEDHRVSMISYVLDDYDTLTASGFNAAGVQQTRQEIIDGMNAEFDGARDAI